MTVEGFDVVPRIVGISDAAGLDGKTELNVITGASLSKFTVLSPDVEAALPLPKVSVTEVAAMDGITVPPPLTAVAVRVQVILSIVESDHVTPVAEPF